MSSSPSFFSSCYTRILPDWPFHNFGCLKFVSRRFRKICRSRDLEALKLWKNRSGRHYIYTTHVTLNFLKPEIHTAFPDETFLPKLDHSFYAYLNATQPTTQLWTPSCNTHCILTTTLLRSLRNIFHNRWILCTAETWIDDFDNLKWWFFFVGATEIKTCAIRVAQAFPNELSERVRRECIPLRWKRQHKTQRIISPSTSRSKRLTQHPAGFQPRCCSPNAYINCKYVVLLSYHLLFLF